MKSFKPLLYISAFILVSCSKGIGKKDTSVILEYRDSLTGEFVTVQDVTIFASKAGSELWDYVDQLENLSDRYEKSWKSKKKWNYELRTEPGDGYFPVFGNRRKDIQKGETNEFYLTALPTGTINFEFDNINCSTESDKLEFTIYYTDNPDMWSGSYYGDEYKGCLTDYVSSIEVPFGELTVDWEVTRSPVSYSSSGSFVLTVPANGSTDYNLQY